MSDLYVLEAGLVSVRHFQLLLQRLNQLSKTRAVLQFKLYFYCTWRCHSSYSRKWFIVLCTESRHCCSTGVKLDCLIYCFAFLLFLMQSCSFSVELWMRVVKTIATNAKFVLEMCLQDEYELICSQFLIRRTLVLSSACSMLSFSTNTAAQSQFSPHSPYICGYIFQEVQKWQSLVCTYRGSRDTIQV